MDKRYFLIIKFHPNIKTNLIIKVSHYSLYCEKDGNYILKKQSCYDIQIF